MFEILEIAARAGFYLSALLAVGSVLCLRLLPQWSAAEQRTLHVTVCISSLIALGLAAAGVALEAVFLAGNHWAAAGDLELLGFVLEGPRGLSFAVLAAGLCLLFAVLVPIRGAEIVSLAGGVLVAISFGLTGHTTSAPGGLLSVLVIVHVLLLAFWIGIFIPLYRVSYRNREITAQVAHQFGRIAVWTVPALAVFGIVVLQQLTGGLVAALSTDYGRLFALKVSLFAVVLGFAAYNKRVLTPALMQGESSAMDHLRRSLRLESGVIFAILLVTATTVTLTGP
ncbi:copper resistance protein CopD [Spiribacter sp. C176]|uniref:Copper resistance protein D n=1 Tax=Spiribacter salilacus TaxID=2664894 RepID=A0A6N7QTC8_9GAMM|nr:CopD family protein [Spiribacter salilacus]MRH77567.1 copper resistance protein CopD [Spiribacter salilacus]